MFSPAVLHSQYFGFYTLFAKCLVDTRQSGDSQKHQEACHAGEEQQMWCQVMNDI